MNSAQDIVNALRTCGRLTEFLELDLKTTTEVGFSLGEHGTVYEFRTGRWDNITFAYSPDAEERRVIIHTHPTIDSQASFSQSDQAIGTQDAVCGMVVLSRDMFDVNWSGRAMYFGDDGDTDTTTFRIECDGSTDGPADERWVENPRFV